MIYKFICNIFGHKYTIFQQQQNNEHQLISKTCGRCGYTELRTRDYNINHVSTKIIRKKNKSLIKLIDSWIKKDEKD